MRLAPEEREWLEHLTSMAEALDVSVGTVFRIKRRFAEEGLDCGTVPNPAGPRSWTRGAKPTACMDFMRVRGQHSITTTVNLTG